jgi:hypothetical protein
MPFRVQHPFTIELRGREVRLLQTRRSCTDLVVDSTVDAVVCYLIPLANTVGIVCERPRSDAVSVPRAVAAEGRDGLKRMDCENFPALSCSC